jgi:hypothetical protein
LIVGRSQSLFLIGVAIAMLLPAATIDWSPITMTEGSQSDSPPVAGLLPWPPGSMVTSQDTVGMSAAIPLGVQESFDWVKDAMTSLGYELTESSTAEPRTMMFSRDRSTVVVSITEDPTNPTSLIALWETRRAWRGLLEER